MSPDNPGTDFKIHSRSDQDPRMQGKRKKMAWFRKIHAIFASGFNVSGVNRVFN